MRCTLTLLLGAQLICPLTPQLPAAVEPPAEWPQFLGPARDGKALPPAPLTADFPETGPKILWRHPVGEGFSGPVLLGGKVLMFHRRNDTVLLEALEAGTGKLLWQHPWPTQYRDAFGFDEGPRACPAGQGDTVVVYGADGLLAAVSLTDGAEKWKCDTVREFGSAPGFFGRAPSPLIMDGKVIITPGGDGARVAAFSLTDGRVLWKSASGEAAYASPVRLPEGKDRFVSLTREGLTVLHDGDGHGGKEARFRAAMEASVNAATPVFTGPDTVFTSACYDVGAVLWRVGADDSLTPVWKKEGALDCHYATPVFLEGALYGFHGRQESGQELRCLDAAQGAVLWSERMAPGHVLLNGKTLVILTEKGEVILADASREKFAARTRGQILTGPHRSPPALAGGVLYARDRKTLVAVDLRE